jgi:hypothetical protein
MSEPTLNTAELRLLADREKKAQDKRQERARRAKEHAKAAALPNPSGYVVPPMPGRIPKLRVWYRQQHDAFSQRQLGPLELAEVRRSFTTMLDSYKAAAFVRTSHAAVRSAMATERMAEILAAVEHGGTALLMLSRLQEGLVNGPRRPLPGLPAQAKGTPS